MKACELAFRKLQRKLEYAPILAFSDLQTFMLGTDASNEGIGAVLSKWKMVERLLLPMPAGCSAKQREVTVLPEGSC